MKTMNSTTFLATLILAIVAGSLSAADKTNTTDSSSIRSDSEKAFIQMTSNSIDALKQALKDNEIGVKGTSDAKFRISEVQTPNQTSVTTSTTTADGTTTTSTSTSTVTTSSNLGIKVWFELKDGTLVNPTKKRWSAKETFYIHVQAAVPVYVALYQNYPDSRPLSRQIYPDSKYKNSFKAIQPGQSTKLPVTFEMDDDQRDEIMSMVVVRSDWSGIQNGLTAQATASVTSNNGTAQITAQVNTTGAGTLKCINDRVVGKKDLTKEDAHKIVENISEKQADNIAKAVNEAASVAKFQIVGSDPVTSTQANDVCFYMFGAGHIGQWQLTIKK